MIKLPVLYVVVPCYNEKEVLFETANRLNKLFDKMELENKINQNSRIVFVDDGSRDNTWQLITECHNENKRIYGIKLSGNVGHQNALLGGLLTVKDECDCAISIDADLQDDIFAIEEMISKYAQGCDVVYGVRNKRDTDTFFKRTTALAFYKFMKILGVNCVYNHADYRLMSKRALDALSQFPEKNLFLRGLVPLVGFRSENVFYDRSERFAGESKYPLKKMLSFAFDGITSFSVNPIRLITLVGFITCVISALILIYSLIQKFTGSVEPGWTSIICSIWLIGGLQLMGIGLIGEYIGKIYKEVKNRPRYIVEKYLKK